MDEVATIKTSITSLIATITMMIVMVVVNSVYASQQNKRVDLDVLKRIQTRTLDDLAQQISVDRQTNTIAESKLAQLRKRHQEILKISDQEFSVKLLENKQLALAEAKADRLNITQLLIDAKARLREIQTSDNAYREKLRDAEARAVNKKAEAIEIDRLKLQIDYLQTYASLQSTHIHELESTNRIAEEVVRLEQEIYDHLVQMGYRTDNLKREKKLIQLSDQLQNKRALILDQLKAFHTQLEKYDEDQRYNDPEAIRIALTIFQSEEEIYIGDQALRIEHLDDDVSDLIATSHENLTVREIDKFLFEIKELSLHITHAKQRIKDKLELVNSKLDIQKQFRSQDILTVSEYQTNYQILESLIQAYKAIDTRANSLQKSLSEHEASLRVMLNKNIALRQGFPGWNLEEWNNLLHKITRVPVSIISLSKTLRDHVKLSLQNITPTLAVMLLAMNGIWLLFIYFGRSLLQNIVNLLTRKREKMSVNVALGFVEVARRNFFLIMTFIILFSTLYVLQIPFKTYRFIFMTYLIIAGVVLAVELVRIALLERLSDASGMDVRLYHLLKWGLMAIGLVLLLHTLSKEINVAYDVRDFFNRIFMILLFVFSLALFRIRKFISGLLFSLIDQQRYYFKRVVQLLSWLIPASLLLNAVVGLLGYLQLAGFMSYYQLMVLLVTTAYVILRGLLIDSMELLADTVIRMIKNGWLISQSLLIPLDKVLRFALFAFSIVVLFYSFGWGMESYAVIKLNQFINTPLINLTGAQITLLSFAEFIIMLIIVIWAARWSREFSYRLLFAEVRDQSMRNSLAAFTRYSTIILGAIITLNVLGINISGLSYILGGLAVGLGFGLRDFANNIVSGVMLLIERPVREGDIVSISEYEGVVSRIGLRSMMVKSYDYMEVMVPNADILNKTFINWTHQDSIARTVIPIKVHRDDDPIKVQEIILQVLHELPAVLDDPEPKVFLRKIDEALIYMEARYFINLEHNLRVSVQSLVLFSIWERFKSHHIRAPFPQQDIRLLEDAQDE